MRTVPIGQWGYARWALGFTVFVILLPLCIMMLDLTYMARGRRLEIPESMVPSKRLAWRTAGPVAPYQRLWRQLDDCGNWQKDYIRLQNDVIRGRTTERVVISVAIPAGDLPFVQGCVATPHVGIVIRLQLHL